METEIAHDPITRQIIANASAMPALKSDFTDLVLARIEAETTARTESIYKPLISGYVWRWIGITLCSMLLITLSLGVLAFSTWPGPDFANVFLANLNKPFFDNQPSYIPKLFLIGLICLCWLVLDYLYSQLKKRDSIG